jgi:hypothetical protein
MVLASIAIPRLTTYINKHDRDLDQVLLPGSGSGQRTTNVTKSMSQSASSGDGRSAGGGAGSSAGGGSQSVGGGAGSLGVCDWAGTFKTKLKEHKDKNQSHFYADDFRMAVFRSTVVLLEDERMRQAVHAQAKENLDRWAAPPWTDESGKMPEIEIAKWFSEKYGDVDLKRRIEYPIPLNGSSSSADSSPGDGGASNTVCVFLCEGDWAVVSQRLTQKYGQIFAVLNMANAYVAGGGVVDGMIAQGE